MTKIVIFNSPPRSAKDVTADELIKRNPWYTTSFKNQLLEIALTVAPVSKIMWDVRYETDKDLPWDILGGLSQRQFLIKISEEWVKPVFGTKYFGKSLVKNVLESIDADMYDGVRGQQEVFIVSDGGFFEEVLPIVEEFGEDNVLILRWGREGCDFENDSRDWIDGFNFIQDLPNNNGTLEEHFDRVECCIKAWLNAN